MLRVLGLKIAAAMGPLGLVGFRALSKSIQAYVLLYVYLYVFVDLHVLFYAFLAFGGGGGGGLASMSRRARCYATIIGFRV